VAVPVIVFMIVRVYQTIVERQHTSEHRPVVTNSNPPVLIQPFSCDVKSGAHFGDINTFMRNVGNADALAVTPSLILRFVPDRKVGQPEFDEIPSAGCGQKRKGNAARQLAAAQGGVVRWSQPTVAMPPLLNGETAQLYAMSCIHYTDSSGVDHSNCDTYRFRLDSGIPIFACDNLPKSGKFDPETVSNCTE
jgi:hypothetical protein